MCAIMSRHKSMVAAFISFPRSRVGMQIWPLQRPVALRDAGASRLAPTLEHGSQKTEIEGKRDAAAKALQGFLKGLRYV
jgi:hypothetical protein